MYAKEIAGVVKLTGKNWIHAFSKMILVKHQDVPGKVLVFDRVPGPP